MRHFAGVLWRPRSTMAALVAAPAIAPAWLLALALWLIPGGWLLSTDVGRQAVVDERVRVTEAFGGHVTDDQYDAWQASPPWSTYFTSGGRLLLAPPVTALVALGLMWLARPARLSAAAALAISVCALAPLVLQQLVATPLHYLRESLTSPTNLAVVAPVDDGAFAARLLGGIDVFALWWLWLLAVGLAAVTARPARRHLALLVGVYVGLTGALAAVLAVAGGS